MCGRRLSKKRPRLDGRTLEILKVFPCAKTAMAHDGAKRCNGVGGSCCFSEMDRKRFGLLQQDRRK
jgi:hypothetical protein